MSYLCEGPKIDDVILGKMKSRMAKNDGQTLSQCARELIELALKVEEAASLQDGELDDNFIPPELMAVIKTNMEWVLETRFLTRFLVEKMKTDDTNAPNNFMKDAQALAKSHIGGLMEKINKSK